MRARRSKQPEVTEDFDTLQYYFFAPYVTGCTPSSMLGRDYVDSPWENRKDDPAPLKMEFNGPNGRRCLMRWVLAKAYKKGVYYAFTDSIEYGGYQLKNGNSILLDPYGEVISEVKSFDDEVTVARITRDKLKLAGDAEMNGGLNYTNMYIGRDHSLQTKPTKDNT